MFLDVLPFPDDFCPPDNDPSGISSSFWASSVPDDKELVSPDAETDGFLEPKPSFHLDFPFSFSAVLAASLGGNIRSCPGLRRLVVDRSDVGG